MSHDDRTTDENAEARRFIVEAFQHNERIINRAHQNLFCRLWPDLADIRDRGPLKPCMEQMLAEAERRWRPLTGRSIPRIPRDFVELAAVVGVQVPAEDELPERWIMDRVVPAAVAHFREIMLMRRSASASSSSADPAPSAMPALNGAAKDAADFIVANPGAQGPEIAHEIGKAETTFYKHIVPKLRKVGFRCPGKADRSAGYHPPQNLV